MKHPISMQRKQPRLTRKPRLANNLRDIRRAAQRGCAYYLIIGTDFTHPTPCTASERGTEVDENA